tara:strand:- start:3288 stop:5492 length:2205 start_codon:yes stop_codon:yes gene_type:complete
MAFTKVTNAGIGSTNTVLLHNLNVVGTVTATNGIFSGIGSFGGNVTVGGVLTYEDVTNVDSVGLITARKGINVLGTGVTIAAGGLNVNAGVSTFGADVSIADKIIHSGDTNTAIRFPAADTITAETGGSERVRITSTGLFGVGVTPSSIFHVRPLDETNFLVRNEGSTVVLASETNSGRDNNRGMALEATQFEFIEGGSEKVRINSSGKVGIGTDNPDQNLEIHQQSGTNLVKLSTHANSTIGLEIEKTGATTQSWRIADGQTVNGALEFYDVTDSATRLMINGSGHILMGTSTEGHSNADDLTVATSGNTGITIRSGSSNNGNIFFSDATSGAGEYQGMVYYNHSDNKLSFATLGTDRLVIDSSGNANITGVTTASHFVPSTAQPYGTKNLIINGAMKIAQRGTSLTGDHTSGYGLCDRWYATTNVINVDLVSTQHALTSSDTGPWEEGFRYSYHQAQGYQGSVQAGNYVQMQQKIEAQDIAQSGWNYLSSSSYLTLSFWAKASISQTYFGYIRCKDGTEKMFPYSFALTANTWKKVVVKIPGDSGLTFNNDTGEGLQVNIAAYWGTDFTDAGTSLNTWANWNGSGRTPVNTSTWFTTNGSTFEITGVQLEVGSEVTPFEHITYAQDLRACERYYQKVHNAELTSSMNTSTRMRIAYKMHVPMRASPSWTRTATALSFQGPGVNVQSTDTSAAQNGVTGTTLITWDFAGFTSLGQRSWIGSDANHVFSLSSEL